MIGDSTNGARWLRVWDGCMAWTGGRRTPLHRGMRRDRCSLLQRAQRLAFAVVPNHAPGRAIDEWFRSRRGVASDSPSESGRKDFRVPMPVLVRHCRLQPPLLRTRPAYGGQPGGSRRCRQPTTLGVADFESRRWWSCSWERAVARFGEWPLWSKRSVPPGPWRLPTRRSPGVQVSTLASDRERLAPWPTPGPFPPLPIPERGNCRRVAVRFAPCLGPCGKPFSLDWDRPDGSGIGRSGMK